MAVGLIGLGLPALWEGVAEVPPPLRPLAALLGAKATLAAVTVGTVVMLSVALAVVARTAPRLATSAARAPWLALYVLHLPLVLLGQALLIDTGLSGPTKTLLLTVLVPGAVLLGHALVRLVVRRREPTALPT